MPVTTSEFADLARRMERYPEDFLQDDDEDDLRQPALGIAPDTREWDLCVEALKAVAQRG